MLTGYDRLRIQNLLNPATPHAEHSPDIAHLVSPTVSNLHSPSSKVTNQGGVHCSDEVCFPWAVYVKLELLIIMIVGRSKTRSPEQSLDQAKPSKCVRRAAFPTMPSDFTVIARHSARAGVTRSCTSIKGRRADERLSYFTDSYFELHHKRPVEKFGRSGLCSARWEPYSGPQSVD